MAHAKFDSSSNMYGSWNVTLCSSASPSLSFLGESMLSALAREAGRRQAGGRGDASVSGGEQRRGERGSDAPPWLVSDRVNEFYENVT